MKSLPSQGPPYENTNPFEAFGLLEWLGLRRKDESEMVGTQGGGMPKA